MSTHTSESCCNTPFPSSSSSSNTTTYTPAGDYTTLASLKCYVTGARDASKAIVAIYDIFGFQSPTFRGADILAQAGYLVVMPDLFHGDAAKMEWLTRGTDADKKAFGEWRARIADPKPNVEKIGSVLEAAKGEFSEVQKWGCIGYCWGGKLVSLTSGPDTPWAVGVQSSPSAVSTEDAKKITIPSMMLASKGESVADVEAFEKALTVPHVVETFGDQIHGWMSARADLQNEGTRNAYEKGYRMVLEFFEKWM